MATEVLEGRLLSRLTRTIHHHRLIAPGDKVMVCLSGGKDSYTLLHLLELARRRWEFEFELVAVHLDQRQPGYDGAPLRRWLEASGIAFEILSEDTYSEVIERTAEGGTPCAAFAAGVGFPILPCNLCGSQKDLKRDAMNGLLQQLESMNPNVRQSMVGALSNVRATHLLDREVAEAWAARPAHLEARSQPKETIARFAALPVHKG